MAYAPPDRDSGRAQRGGLARKARVVSRQPSASTRVHATPVQWPAPSRPRATMRAAGSPRRR